MLKPRGALKPYKPEQITHWLSYLARQMRRQNQTLFYIEQMQPYWLPKLWQRSLYRALGGILLGGLLGGLLLSALALLGGLILFFVFILDQLAFLPSMFTFNNGL